MTMPTMKLLLKYASIVMMFGALLCACDSSNTPSNTQTPSASSTQPSSNISAATYTPSATTPSVDSLLKKDMAYADARKVLLTQGWVPERDADCKTNMGADDSAKCDVMPELSIYSDQGVLITHFRHGQQQLTISSYGMLSDWKVSGDGSRLRITDWQTSSTTAKDGSTTP